MRAFVLMPLLFLVPSALQAQNADEPNRRPRARDMGIKPGIYDPGPKNSITDVSGVLVGQTTIREGEKIRTGVTVILPHRGNLYQEKVAAAV
jgi:D-aminopeptidase